MGRSTLHPSMLGNIRMSFMLYRREGEMAAVKARFLGLLREVRASIRPISLRGFQARIDARPENVATQQHGRH